MRFFYNRSASSQDVESKHAISPRLVSLCRVSLLCLFVLDLNADISRRRCYKVRFDFGTSILESTRPEKVGSIDSTRYSSVSTYGS